MKIYFGAVGALEIERHSLLKINCSVDILQKYVVNILSVTSVAYKAIGRKNK